MNTLKISEQELKGLVEKANLFVGNTDGGKKEKMSFSRYKLVPKNFD